MKLYVYNKRPTAVSLWQLNELNKLKKLKTAKMTREQELNNDGWTKQSTHDEPRLSDIVEMYEEIGLEVLLEPFNPDEEPGCTECMRGSARNYKTIYTRNKLRV